MAFAGPGVPPSRMPKARARGLLDGVARCGSTSSALRDVVHRALARDVDRAAERALGLPARPGGVELVRQVGEDEPLGPGARAVLAGLGRREVPALALGLWVGERGLDEQQVGALGQLAQRVVGRAVGGEREARAVLLELDGV